MTHGGIEGYDELSSVPTVTPPPLLAEQLADVVYVATFEPKVLFEYVSANVVDMIGWTATTATRTWCGARWTRATPTSSPCS